MKDPLFHATGEWQLHQDKAPTHPVVMQLKTMLLMRQILVRQSIPIVRKLHCSQHIIPHNKLSLEMKTSVRRGNEGECEAKTLDYPTSLGMMPTDYTAMH